MCHDGLMHAVVRLLHGVPNTNIYFRPEERPAQAARAGTRGTIVAILADDPPIVMIELAGDGDDGVPLGFVDLPLDRAEVVWWPRRHDAEGGA